MQCSLLYKPSVHELLAPIFDEHILRPGDARILVIDRQGCFVGDDLDEEGLDCAQCASCR